MAVGFCDSLQLQIGFPCFIQPLRGEPKIRGSRCDRLEHPILPHLLINKSSRGTRSKGAQEQRQELPRVGEKPTTPLRYLLYFISMYVHEYAGHGTRVGGHRTTWESLPRGFQQSHSCCQSWWQAPLPAAEPSHWPRDSLLISSFDDSCQSQ